MVFQDSMTSLDPLMPIGRQIAEGMIEHLGLSPGARPASARSTLLDEVGVPDAERRLAQFPHQLSGGLRQRVAIAVAIAANPDVLIADEPTTALDVTIQAQILDLLERERRQRGMALILITHDLGVVASVTDRMLVMYAGRVVESDRPPSDLRRPAPPLHARAARAPCPGSTRRCSAAPARHPGRAADRLRPTRPAARSRRAARTSSTAACRGPALEAGARRPGSQRGRLLGGRPSDADHDAAEPP